jgi:hypothetical protein
MNENENTPKTNDIDAVREVVLNAYPDCVPRANS